MTYEEFVVSYENLVVLLLKHSHRADEPYSEALGKLVDEFPKFEERYDIASRTRLMVVCD